MKTRAKDRTQKIALTAVFSALIAAGAFLRIPIPYVPFTMQFFFVNTAMLVLGKKWGTLSVAVYMLIGLLGVPVFTKGGGIFYVLEPTFGYMLGFLLGNFLGGLYLEKVGRKRYANLVIAGLIDSASVYALGVPYFYLISTFYLGNAVTAKIIFLSCFLMTLWSDVIFVFFTAFAVKKLEKRWKLPSASEFGTVTKQKNSNASGAEKEESDLTARVAEDTDKTNREDVRK